MTLTHVACALCGYESTEKQFAIRDWQIVDCGRCGLRFVSPRPENEAYSAIYAKDYFRSPDSVKRGYEDYEGDAISIVRTFQRRWNKIERFAQSDLDGGRYLDIGCAYGYGLDVGRERVLKAVGVDLSSHAVDVASSRGHDVILGTLEAAFPELKKKGPFRVITGWDVIEHLPDPERHVSLIAELLEPGGIVSMITPDRSSMTARMFGRSWVEYQKPEEHIYFFRRSDIETFLLRDRFEVVSESTAGKYVSLRFAIGRLAESMPFLRPLRWPINLMGDRVVYVDPMDKMHVIARKSR